MEKTLEQLKAEGFELVTGYRDVLVKFDVLVRNDKPMAIVVIRDVRTGWCSYNKVVGRKEPTDQELKATTYIIERDCCTSGQCVVCREWPRGTKVRVEHTRTKDKLYAAEIALNWKEFNAVVIPTGV